MIELLSVGSILTLFSTGADIYMILLIVFKVYFYSLVSMKPISFSSSNESSSQQHYQDEAAVNEITLQG